MRHFQKRRQQGQSAVLMAFMILVLVAMVALSVDVGNAYGQQRRVQTITNAGAKAGMASAMTTATNDAVWADVQRSLTGNRTKITADYTFTVDYILEDGTVSQLGEWNGEMATVVNGNSAPPANLERMQVTMSERIKTKFANVVGRPTLGVTANGVACFGDYGYGVYPIGVPLALQKPVTDASGHETQPGVRLFQSNGQALPFNDARWGAWNSSMQGMTLRIPLTTSVNTFISGVHAPFLNWGGETQTVGTTSYTALSIQKGNSALSAALIEPGTLQDGFLEAISVDAAKPNSKPMTILQRGDWISGSAIANTTVQSNLNYLISKQTKMMLPIYDASGGSASPQTAFHMVNMGYFMLRGAKVSGNTKYMDLLYLGTAVASPTECGSEEPESAINPKQFTIKGDVLNNRVWKSGKSSRTTTYDIVVIMDTSGSMAYDWQDRDVGESGYKASNARINDAKKVVRDFVREYDISSDKGDPDARIAFVTFGGSTAVVQSGFQAACSSALIEDECGNKDAKWSTVQVKAAAMTPSGYTPGPRAFEAVETLLANKRTPPAGKKFAQIVVFATDGVFNVCGNAVGERPCTAGQLTPREGNASNNDVLYNSAYNAVSGRPIWQAQQVATRIKNSGANIFIVALTPTCRAGDTGCFNPAGLSDMSSGSNYYHQANESGALEKIYENIGETIVYDTCVPNEITEPVNNATVVLTKPDNPTWRQQVKTNSAGMFEFDELQAGQYIVKVEPSITVKSPEDDLTRTYSRTRNGRSLSEEGQASVYVNPQFADGATVSTQLLLSLPFDASGSPNNACTMPAASGDDDD